MWATDLAFREHIELLANAIHSTNLASYRACMIRVGQRSVFLTMTSVSTSRNTGRLQCQCAQRVKVGLLDQVYIPRRRFCSCRLQSFYYTESKMYLPGLLSVALLGIGSNAQDFTGVDYTAIFTTDEPDPYYGQSPAIDARKCPNTLNWALLMPSTQLLRTETPLGGGLRHTGKLVLWSPT
jgi:hypothetical protein